MKVLVWAHNDSDNLMISNILKELKRRGHKLRIFAYFLDEKSIRMFVELKVEISHISTMTDKDLEWADCIFTALRAHIDIEMLRDRMFVKKYIFVYNNYLENTWFSPGADFMFTSGNERDMKHLEDCARMAVGCPKNDSLREINNQEGLKKNILFIDSGHYPFSHKGKCQVADMLLKICKLFSDYNVIIKPRFLLNDKNNLHSNDDHIYKIIDERAGGRIPDNLIMPNRHLDMQHMIDECRCAILLSSSSYLDVALRGKNFLIVKDIENEDKYELRNEIEYKNVYDLREKSGCCVKLDEIYSYLPDGLKCNEEHLAELVAYKENASEKIVDVMEYIKDSFLDKGLFPAIARFTYEEGIVADEKLSWNELLHKRIKNIGNNQLNLFNRIVGDINISEYLKELDETYINYDTTYKGIKQFLENLENIRYKILFENRSLLMDDPLNQSELFRVYYNHKNYVELCGLTEDEILCKGAWHYYMGMICYQEKDYDVSMTHFYHYLKEASTRSFAKYECENIGGLKNAYCSILNGYNGDNLLPEQFAEIFIIMFEKKVNDFISNRDKKIMFSDMLVVNEVLLNKENYELAAKSYAYYISNIKDIDESQDVIRSYDEVRTSLSFRLGRVILAIPRKVYLDVQNVKINGFRNAFRGFVERRISTPLRNSPLFKINYFFHNQILEGYNEYKSIVLKNGIKRQYFLGDLGSGNIYLCGFFLEEYIAQSKMKENTYLLPERNCKEVAELFPMENMNYCEIEHKSFGGLIRLLRFFNNSTINVVYLNYHHLWLNHTGILTYLERINGWNMFELYKAVFAEQIDVKRKVPKMYENNEAVYRIIQENGLKKGKTIILVPYAGTYARISESFWEELAIRFRQRGYTVITSVDPEKEKAITGTNGVFVPYQVWGTFLEYSGGLVGLRNGLLDVSEDIKCKKVALYTTTRERFQNGDKSYLESFSINDMYERDDWLELKVRLTNQQKVLEAILNYFGKE